MRQKGKGTVTDRIWLCCLILGLLWTIFVPFVFPPSYLSRHSALVEAVGGTTVSMVTAGALAKIHSLSLLLALVAPLAAVFRVSPLYWWAGRRYGPYLVDVLASKSPNAQKLARRTEVLFEHLGPWTVMFAYFLPVPNGLVFAASGWTGMSLAMFLIFDLLGTFLYSEFVVLLGYFVGESAVKDVQLITRGTFIFIIVSAVSVVAYLYLRQRSLRSGRSSRELFLGHGSSAESEGLSRFRVGGKVLFFENGLDPNNLSEEVLRDEVDRCISRHKNAAVTVGVIDANGTETLGAIDPRYLAGSAAALCAPYQLGTFTSVLTGTYLGAVVALGSHDLAESWDSLVDGDFEAIPLERLATHTSGLPFLPWNYLYRSVKTGDDPFCSYDVEDLFQASHKRRRASVGYRYSNVGMSLVGLGLGSGSVKGYIEGMQRHVLEPLGLESTGFSSCGSPTNPTGYRHGSKIEIGASGPFSPAMGAISTPIDLMRFMRHVLRPEESSIAEAIRLCQRTHSVSKDSMFAMGLGWHVFLGRQGTWLYHDIKSFGTSGIMAIHPQMGWGMFIISNCGDASTQVSIDGWTRALLARCLIYD